MYYVNKIIGFVLNPLFVLLAGLGAAGLARALGSRFKVQRAWVRRLPMWIAGLSLAFTWFMGTGIATRLIGVPLEVAEVDLTTLPNADAIVLLGGGMGLHQTSGHPEMFASADRVWAAARLYKAGKAPIMFVTGTNNLAATSGLLADFGVPTNALRSVAGARNTEEEAKGIFRMFECSNVRETECSNVRMRECSNVRGEGKIGGETAKPRILLVTSAWHMKRAKAMFEKYAPGLEVVAAPTDFEMSYPTEEDIGIGSFIPGPEAMFHNVYALKEWVARFGYAVFR